MRIGVHRIKRAGKHLSDSPAATIRGTVFHVHNILLEDGRIESGQFELTPTSQEGQAVCTVFVGRFLKNRPNRSFRDSRSPS